MADTYVCITHWREVPCEPLVYGVLESRTVVDFLTWDGLPQDYQDEIERIGWDGWTLSHFAPPDTWHIVEIDDMPDHVYAEIARRALLDDHGGCNG